MVYQRDVSAIPENENGNHRRIESHPSTDSRRPIAGLLPNSHGAAVSSPIAERTSSGRALLAQQSAPAPPRVCNAAAPSSTVFKYQSVANQPRYGLRSNLCTYGARRTTTFGLANANIGSTGTTTVGMSGAMTEMSTATTMKTMTNSNGPPTLCEPAPTSPWPRPAGRAVCTALSRPTKCICWNRQRVPGA